MKANELRLGNLYDNNGNYFVVTPSTIESVFESDRVWCKPIPLTEEILLKCGFTENENGEPQIDTFEGMALSISIKESPYKYTAWHVNTTECKYYMFAECKYLHQVQNLYFALTGNELSVTKI